MAVGYIYILSNRAHPELLKVGFTCNAVSDRAVELSSTGVPEPVEIECFRLTANVEEVEQLIHEALRGARPNLGREFFRLRLAEAVEVVERYVRRPIEGYIRQQIIRPDSELLRECRRCGHRFERGEGYVFCQKCGF